MKTKTAFFILLSFSWFFSIKDVSGQDSAELDRIIDSLFSELEEDSFFTLIDSLVNTPPIEDRSEVMLKFSYLSKISTMGRDMGIDQYGLSPGITYFHRSGLFSDVTGYWNSGDSMDMNYTMVTVGYMKDFGKVLGMILTYDHSFYQGEGYDLKNSIGISSYLSFNLMDLGLDYILLFGNTTAHRINLSLSGYFRKKEVLLFDKITFTPKVSAMLGTSNVVNDHYTMDQIRRYLPSSDRVRGGRNQLTNDQISNYYNVDEGKEFGIMNYNFSLPIKLYIKKFGIGFSYNFNIPVPLPGEDVVFPSYSYYSLSTTYRFGFGK